MSAVSEPPAGPAPAGTEWMQVIVVAPDEVGMAVLELLRNFGFRDTDFCVLERRVDYSRVDYDPAPARTAADYEYSNDWRKQQ
jgi:hypothetical protein